MHYHILTTNNTIVGKSESLLKAKLWAKNELKDYTIAPNLGELVMISSQYKFVSYGRYKLTSCIGFNGEYMDFSCTTTDTEFIDAIKSGEVPDYEKQIYELVISENTDTINEWVMSENDDDEEDILMSYYLDADGVVIIK